MLDVGVLDRQAIVNFRQLISKGVFALLADRSGDYIVLGAVMDGAPCGVIVAAPEADGAHIVHLFVEPPYRGRGVGSMLMDSLVAGLPVIPGAKLRCTFARGGGELSSDPAYIYFSKYGFRVATSEGGVYRTTLGAISAAPFWRQGADAHCGVEALADLPAEAVREFNRKTMSELDLAYPPYGGQNILDGVSCAAMVEGRIKGIAAVTDDSGSLDLAWLYCERAHIKCLPGLLRAVYGAAEQSWPPDTRVFITVASEAATKLGEKLCPPSDFFPSLKAEAEVSELRADVGARRRVGELSVAVKDDMSWWDGLWAS
jgi:GNAT superfamily N-acetyltransferase